MQQLKDSKQKHKYNSLYFISFACYIFIHQYYWCIISKFVYSRCEHYLAAGLRLKYLLYTELMAVKSAISLTYRWTMTIFAMDQFSPQEVTRDWTVFITCCVAVVTSGNLSLYARISASHRWPSRRNSFGFIQSENKKSYLSNNWLWTSYILKYSNYKKIRDVNE